MPNNKVIAASVINIVDVIVNVIVLYELCTYLTHTHTQASRPAPLVVPSSTASIARAATCIVLIVTQYTCTYNLYSGTPVYIADTIGELHVGHYRGLAVAEGFYKYYYHYY